jgi:predicted RecB family nuclease
VARPPAEARAAAAAGLPYFSPELGPLLDLPAPRAFLDFEAYAPALPRVDGAGPFEILPFLWACVREAVDGEVQIEAQAADGPDPRRAFATTLLAALPADGPILTWSAFEGRTLRRLATVLPELAARLHAAAERVVDLHAIVRAKVWHPDLDGSYSLKRVLPALAPERPWEDLAVSTGHDAAMLALGAENGALDPAEAARVRAALLRYCAADATALRTVLLALQAAAAR